MPRRPQAEFAAFVGLDGADATPEVCWQAVDSATREVRPRAPTPEAIDAWARALQERCAGRPVAVCRERSQGPLVSALRQYECLVLFPVNPVPLATYRQAFTPRHAKDAPTDAALPLERVLTQRDTRHPLMPQSAARRALAPLVAHRRGVVGDTGRLTNRLTHTLKHDLPHVLDWFDDQDTTRVCDFLAPWPTLQAAQLARRATLARCFRNPHGRSAAVIDQRIQAITSATPLTTTEGVSAPPALLGQALVSQRRVTLQAIEDVDHAIAQRTQRYPAFPWFAALPGAGAIFAPRLCVAFGEQRERYAAADARQTYAGMAPGT